MNPFAWTANLFISMLPPDAPEWMVGSAALGGIFAVLVGVGVVISPAVWIWEKRQ